MTKNRRIGNVLALIVSLLIIILTVVFTVQTLIINKNNEDTKLATSDALDESFYSGLIASDPIDDSIFEFHVDHATNTATLVGLKTGDPSWDPLPSSNETNNTGRVLKIPSTYSYNDADTQKKATVTSIDLTNWYKDVVIEDATFANAYNKISCIQAVIIPTTVTKITEGSFFGFSSLVYFESPFIGTERGSSAFGKNGGESKPFVTMFKNASNVNNIRLWSGYNTVEKQVSGTKFYNLDSSVQIAPIEVSWSENDNNANVKLFEVPGTLKKIVITDETDVGVRAMSGLGKQITSSSTVTGYTGVERIELSIRDGANLAFGKYAFSENSNLRSIKLPSSRVTLSEGQFSHCTNLTEITLPSNLIEIPKGCFANCISLAKATVPSTIESIQNGAFTNCTALETMNLYSDSPDNIIDTGFEIDLPTSLKYVGDDAFSSCVKIKRLSFPKSVEYIGSSALQSCLNLEYLSLPFVGCHRGSSHTSNCQSNNQQYHNLFGYIFGQSSNEDGTYSAAQGVNQDEIDNIIIYKIPTKLTTVVITDETSISYGAFHSLEKLQSLTINDGAKLTTGILKDNIELKELSIPTLTAIGNLKNLFSLGTKGSSLFDEGNLPISLKSVSLTNSGSVSSGAFHNCKYIENVTIGEATTYIDSAIFHNNPKLKSLVLPFTGCQKGEIYSGWGNNDNHYWYWRDASIRNSSIWLFSNTSYSGSYVNRTLGHENYYGAYVRYIPSSLESITITNETAIGYYSFLNFSSLKEISIKNNPSYIAGGCMSGCSNLEQLELPYIGHNENKNGNVGFEHVLGFVFGESSYNNSYAAGQFRTYYIPKNLKSVTLSNNVDIITNRAFANMTSLKAVRANGNIGILNDYAFYNCQNLETLMFSNANYTSVGAYAFYNCQRIKNINDFTTKHTTTIGNYAFAYTAIDSSYLDLTKYTKVGSYAFLNCLNITEITIPENVLIGEGVFQNCQYLNNVNLIQKVLTKNLFKNCASLTGINLNGITSIPEGAFSGCSLLQSKDGDNGLILNSEVRSIGSYAFYNCSSLSTFDLSNNLSSIGAYAFSGCIGLEYMTIPRDTVNIATNGWVDCDPNFYFYVYKEEANWPSTWVTNWNCDYPVYVIGHIDEDTFTYRYDTTRKGYYITGVNEDVELSGIVTIPHRYQGLKVVGIDNSGDKKLSGQQKVESYIIPTSILTIDSGVFSTTTRIDLYFQSTEAQIKNMYESTAHADGWETGIEDMGFIDAGMIFYKDYWDLGSDGKTPYIKADKLTLNLVPFNQNYDGTRKTPEIESIIIPGYMKVKENDSDYNIIDRTEIFNYKYEDNVSAGKATITGDIRLATYNDYITNLVSLEITPIRIAGTAKTTFIIKKAIVTLYSQDEMGKNFTLTSSYTGNTHKISVFDNTNIASLPSGTKFSGVLETKSANVGTYSHTFFNYKLDKYNNMIFDSSTSGFTWARDWKVTRNGVDVSDNYTVYLYLDYIITPLEVTLEFTGGMSSSSDTGLYDYEYRYTGIKIKPEARAKDIATGKVVSDCEVLADTVSTGDTAPIYPYEIDNKVYIAFAYLKDNANYKLMVRNSSGEYVEVVPDIYNETQRKAITTKYIIVKGLIEINININRVITPDQDYWSINLNENSQYLKGIGPNSYFIGTLKSSGDKEVNYVFGADNENKITWEKKYIEEASASHDYYIWRTNETGNHLDERDYYEVLVNANVKIQYNDFQMNYEIVNQTTSAIEKTIENPTATEVEGRKYIKIQFQTQGDGYIFKGFPTNFVATENIYTLAYMTTTSDGDQYVTSEGINFNEPKTYQFSITVTGRHFKQYICIIDLVVSKSDYQISENLDKEYDRKVVDFISEGKILKYEKHDSANANLTITFYSDPNGNTPIAAPKNIGIYYTRITAHESKYFNEFNSGIKKFEIKKRKIEIDISGNRTYDGNTIILTPNSASLISKGYLLDADDVINAPDEFVGTIHSVSAEPNSYTATDIIWSPSWGVFNTIEGNVSNNYTVTITGVYVIDPLQFEYTKEDYDDTYDGNFHTGKVNVTTPTEGYTIYYSSNPISQSTDLSTLSTHIQTRADIGEYIIYFAIVMDNYQTEYDSFKIKINEKQIQYHEYKGTTDTVSHRYVELYTGTYQTYRVDILSPWNALVYYSYNNEEFTLQEYEFIDEGDYYISYIIEAPFHETITGNVCFSITYGEDKLPDTYTVDHYSGQYDGAEHGVKVNYPSDSIVKVYYSLDKVNWSTHSPTFIEIGKTTVYVKIVAPNYEPKIFDSYVEIYGYQFEDIEIVGYSGLYDGEIHNATITGTSITKNTDSNGKITYFYNGVQLNLSYTGNPNNVHAQAGFVTDFGYKDAGKYKVWIMIEAENYQTMILGPAEIQIEYLDSPKGHIPYQEFEYSTYSNSKLEINTSHDGIKTYYYYLATFSDGEYKCDFTIKTTIPEELGYYYVRVVFNPSSNAAKMILSPLESGYNSYLDETEVNHNFIQIVPKKVHVTWNETVIYDSFIKSPNPVAETGTSDVLNLLFVQTSPVDADPIEVGEYKFDISIYGNNPNYVLDRTSIIMKIEKLKLNIVINEEVEVVRENDRQLAWKKDSEWDLLGLQLLHGHKIEASMQTSSGAVATYFYKSESGTQFRNYVEIINFDIVDLNGDSVIDSYDVTFDITVRIKEPSIDLTEIMDTVVDYDGLQHVPDKSLSSTLNGCVVLYKSGDAWVNEPTPQVLAGTYVYDIQVAKIGFDTTYGTIKLIIKKADLKIEIDPIDDPDDTSDDEYKIYSATDKKVNYNVTNVFDNYSEYKANGNETHVLYYPSTKVSKENLISFYKNFSTSNTIYSYGQEVMHNAGLYYCVVYFEDNPNKWNESYQISEIEVLKKDINVEFSNPFNYSAEYNREKVSIPLGGATIDTLQLISGHSIDNSFMASFTVRTKSANAGYYDPKTDFEFGIMRITDRDNVNVANNYHPVLSDNVNVVILKTYITADTFIVNDLIKEYDGLPNFPEVITDSDGMKNYKFWRYLNDDITQETYEVTGFPSGVGVFYVEVWLDEGTNYYASSVPRPGTSAVGHLGVLHANVTVTPREQEVIWEDTTLTFDGTGLAPKAYIIDVYDDELELDVFFINDGGEESPTQIKAGNYEAFARFLSKDSAVENNYILLNSYTNFNIEKREYVINIGSLRVENSSSNWSTVVTKDMITDCPQNAVLTDGAGVNAARIFTVSAEPGMYIGNDRFEINIKTVIEGVDVTDSIEYKINGSVLIIASNIVYEAKDVTTKYADGINHSISSLDALNILVPSNKDLCTITYKVAGINEAYVNIEPTFSDAGEYTIDFIIIANGYNQVTGTITITILPQESYVNFNKTLDKTYDGLAHNIATLVQTNSNSAYNGSSSDLVFEYYQKDYSNDGTYVLLYDSDLSRPGNDLPIDAGDYKVRIYSKADSNEAAVLNYTTLDVEYTFTISPKTIDLKLDINEQVEAESDLGSIWTYKKTIVSTDLDDIASGETFDYEISTDTLRRNTFTYKGRLVYEESSLGVSTNTFEAYTRKTNIGSNVFSLTWYVTANSDRTGTGSSLKISSNYNLNLDFKLYIHFKELDIDIAGVEVPYDGQPHYGSININTSPLSGLSQLYRTEGAIDPNKSDTHTGRADIELIQYTNPGEYTVYYLITATDYEEFFGSFTIKIFYIDRKIEVDPVEKTYDGNPIFTKPEGSDYFLPTFSNTLANKTIDGKVYPREDYDVGKVEIIYYLNGSPTSIDSKVGAIAAGQYDYILTIPQSTFYSKTIYKGTFEIKKRTIIIEDNQSKLVSSNYTGSSFSYNIATNTNYNIWYLNDSSVKETLPVELELKGNLITEHADAIKYTGMDTGLVWYNNYYKVMNNGVDMTANYSIDITNASITINKINMSHNIAESYTMPYTGAAQTIKGKFSLYNPLTGWKIYYQGPSQNWIEGYEDFTAINNYQTKIRITYPNYNDEILDVKVVIERAELKQEIESKLSKVYDGFEVFLPEQITLHPELNSEKYVFRYYEYDINRNEYAIMSVIQWNSVKGEYEIVNHSGSYARPVNVGKYSLEVEIPETLNYKGQIIFQEFEITGKKISASWDKTTFVYDGTAKSPTVSFNFAANDMAKIPLLYEYKPLSNGDTSHKNVGVYEVTVIIAPTYTLNNYIVDTDTNKTTFSITKASTTITLNSQRAHGPSDYLFTFSQEAGINYFNASYLADGHTITSTLKCNSNNVGIYNKISEFTWMSSDNNCKIIDSDGNTVTENYNIYYSLSLTINYSDIEYSVSPVEVTYDGQPHSINVVINTLGENFKVQYSETGMPGSYGDANPAYKNVKLNSDKTVGSYIVFFKICDTREGGYAEVIGSSTIKINPAGADLKLTDINNDPKLDKIYDGKSVKNPEVSYNSVGHSSLTYQYYYLSGETYNPIQHNPYLVGHYKLVISVGSTDLGNHNYTSSELTFEFDIDKREIIISHNPVTKFFDYQVWGLNIAESTTVTVSNLAPNEKITRGYIKTISANVGEYSSETAFVLENGICIFSGDEETDRSSNYIIVYDLKVIITESTITATAANYVGTYDGASHTIGVPVLTNTTIPDSSLVIAPPVEYTITYSTSQYGDYQTAPITRTNVGVTMVFFKIVAENFKNFYGNATITIEGVEIGGGGDGGDGEDGGDETEPPIYDPNDPGYDPNHPGLDPEYDPNGDGKYLEYVKNYVYNGQPYNPTPVYHSPSTGVQKIDYYLAENYPAGDPLASVPVNAGNYVMVINVDSDTQYAAFKVVQSFGIYAAAADVVWGDLEFDFGVKLSSNLSPIAPTLARIQIGDITAQYRDINNSLKNADVSLEGIVDENNLAKPGTYNLTASTNDSNYFLKNKTATLTIGKQMIIEPTIRTDLFVEYLSELRIYDTSGNEYIIDEEGEIIKIIYASGHVEENPNLLYKIILDSDKNADGVVKDVHSLSIELNAIDSMGYAIDQCYQWETRKNTEPIIINYEIIPIEFPHSEYTLSYSYQYTWIWDSTLETIEPPLKIEVLKPDGTKITLKLGTFGDSKHLYDYYIESYENNTGVPVDGTLSKINIVANNNYIFEVTKEFQILASEPDVLILKNDATIQFITADYDDSTEEIVIIEDDTVPTRTFDSKATYNYYLGHLYHETLVSDIVNQFANEISLIRVYDSSGELIASEEYATTYFGTGCKVELINGSGDIIDEITAILYGDVDGNGFINYSDLDWILRLLQNNISLTNGTISKHAFYASRVDSSMSYITYSQYDKLVRHLKNEIDINSSFYPSISS